MTYKEIYINYLSLKTVTTCRALAGERYIGDSMSMTNPRPISGTQGTNGSNGYGNGYAARWQLVVSVIAIVIAVSGALFNMVININTLTNTASSLSTRVVALEANLAATQERRARLATEMAALQRNLVEVETQFCAEDALRNLMHANDLRDLSILWLKAMGSELPISNAYYPSIGKCGPDRR